MARQFRIALAFVTALFSACGGGKTGTPTSPSVTGPGGASFKSYDPVMVTMSWTGGATGNPTDAKSVLPQLSTVPDPSRVCGPGSFQVTLYDSSTRFNGLTLRNTCRYTLWFGACVFAGSGSGARPEGFQECAMDAMTTPFGRLYTNGLAANNGVFFINAPRTSHSLVFFWCGEDAPLVGPGSPAISSSKLQCLIT